MRRFKVSVCSIAISTGIALLVFAPGLLAQKVTTTAGGFVGDGGAATKASFETPSNVVQDKSGNLYISDFNGQRIRKVTPTGIISTYAGTGISGFSGDGGPAHAARLSYPTGLAFDSAGDLIVADGGNNRIRMIDTTGKITTIAGTGAAGYTGDGGPAIKATFNQPWGVTYDAKGNLYITDLGNCAVRFVNPSGIINTYAGDGTCGYGGDGGPATSANLNFPRGMVFDSSANYYIADAAGNRIRKVSTSGIISTVAGTGVSGYSGDGGQATSATLWYPLGVALDSSGNLYIADDANGVIRKVDTSGIISTFATNIGFSGLGAMATDSSNNLFVVDQISCVVWEISPAAVVNVFAGTGVCGYSGDGGPATQAELNVPAGVAVDKHGNVGIADWGNNRVRVVDPAGVINTLAGNGTCGFSGDGGPPTSAELCGPAGIAVTSQETVYIADEFNVRIRKVASNIITTYAGTGVQGYNGDGLPALRTNLDDPVAVVVSSFGTPFLVDDFTMRVRKVH